MNINHNIRNIILDKMALNQWKSKMKNLCLEYHDKFEVRSYINDHVVQYTMAVYKSKCIKCLDKELFTSVIGYSLLNKICDSKQILSFLRRSECAACFFSNLTIT